MSLLDDHMHVPADAGPLITGIIVGPNWVVQRLDEIPNESVRVAGLARHGPAWRWKLAENMNDSRRARRTTDYGTEIWHAIRFQAQSVDVVPNRYLDGQDVAVAEAYAIYCDRARRLQTESRILTGVGIEQVAYVSGIEPTVIRDYCSLFFDVLDKLSARYWIASNVIESPHEPLCHLQRMLYRSAYFGGWHACEHWLSRYDRLGESHDLSTTAGRELEQLELMLLAEDVASMVPERVLEISSKLGSVPTSARRVEMSVAELLAAQVSRSLQGVLPLTDSKREAAAPPVRRSAACRSA